MPHKDNLNSEYQFDVFDEYKFIVEDTSKLIDRRSNNTVFLMSIQTFLIAGIGFVVISFGFADPFTWFLWILLSIIGLYTSSSWLNTSISYRQLLSLRFKILKEIESHPDMQESAKLYSREEAYIYSVRKREGATASIERLLPNIFIVFHALSLAAIGANATFYIFTQ